MTDRAQMAETLQPTKAYHRQATTQGKLKPVARNFRRLIDGLAAQIDLPRPGVRSQARPSQPLTRSQPHTFQAPTVPSDYRATARDQRRPTLSRAQFEQTPVAELANSGRNVNFGARYPPHFTARNLRLPCRAAKTKKTTRRTDGSGPIAEVFSGTSGPAPAPCRHQTGHRQQRQGTRSRDR